MHSAASCLQGCYRARSAVCFSLPMHLPPPPGFFASRTAIAPFRGFVLNADRIAAMARTESLSNVASCCFRAAQVRIVRTTLKSLQ